MIRQMIALDPTARPTFHMLLAGARGTVLPECFYSFLHEYVASVGERPSSLPFPSSSFSVSNAPPSTYFPAATSNTTIKVPSKETVATAAGATGNGSVLPGDSDHRLERLWEEYENVDPYLDDTDVEKTVMDVKVEFGNNVAGPSKPFQVPFAFIAGELKFIRRLTLLVGCLSRLHAHSISSLKSAFNSC